MHCGCSQSAPQISDPTTNPVQSEFGNMPVEKRSATIQGDWQATAAMLAGAPFPDTVTAGTTLSIAGTGYSVLVNGNPDIGTCDLDETSEPVHLTIRGTEGPNKGKTFLVICDFPGNDEMRICYDLTGTSFPDEFSSTAENGWFLVTYQRKQVR